MDYKVGDVFKLKDINYNLYGTILEIKGDKVFWEWRSSGGTHRDSWKITSITEDNVTLVSSKPDIIIKSRIAYLEE